METIHIYIEVIFLFWWTLVERMTIPLPASEDKREAPFARVFLQEIQKKKKINKSQIFIS